MLVVQAATAYARGLGCKVMACKEKHRLESAQLHGNSALVRSRVARERDMAEFVSPEDAAAACAAGMGGRKAPSSPFALSPSLHVCLPKPYSEPGVISGCLSLSSRMLRTLHAE